MNFFIDYTNVRPGNRGGRDQFKWEDVTLKSYKDREMYLGGASKMGFLSSGGKWRKRDWWHNYAPDLRKSDQNEKERIKQEEMDMIYEAAGAKKDPKKNPKASSTGAPEAPEMIQPGKEKLTKYEWNELFKKEAKFTPDDVKLFEFYENDEKKRGLGMKPQISFRTNPYASDVIEGMTKLDGYGLEEAVKEDNNKEDSQRKSLSKERRKPKRSRSRSRSRSHKKDKKHHKSKKHKKDKSKKKDKNKEKKEKSRKKSRTHSRSKSLSSRNSSRN